MFCIFFSISLILGYGSCGDAKCDRDINKFYRFGPSCAFLCHCLDASEQCDFSTGNCTSGCDWEWGGPGCQYRNIAFRAFSRHLDNLPYPRYSDRANDDDLETCSETNYYSAYLHPTHPRKHYPWWKIWFALNVTFKDFTIFTREEKLKYFQNFNVSVENVPEDEIEEKEFYPQNHLLCYTNRDAVPPNTTITVTCDRPLVGNQLRIQLGDVRSQLVICDIRILHGRNVAFAKPANQSSSTSMYSPSYAVDGRTDHYYFTWDASSEPSWTVSIGFLAKVSAVRIFWQQVPSQYSILASNDSTEWTYVYTSGRVSYLTNITVEATARYFRVTQAQPAMALLEVQVYGDCTDDMCGLDCSQVCHCKHPTLQDKVSGVCSSGCQDRFTGTDGKCDTENIAFNMISRHLDNSPDKHSSNLAVDDDLETCSETGGANLKRTASPWWKVWFPENETFIEVHLLTKEDKLDFFSDFNVTVEYVPKVLNTKKTFYPEDSKLCYSQNNSTPSSRFLNIVCDKPLTGNQLRIQLGKISTQLVICDLRIPKACTIGTFGPKCAQNCSKYCENDCHPVDGSCQPCKAGWEGNKCTEPCKSGSFGRGCINICSKNCEDVCSATDGSCQNCKAGWIGTNCTQPCTVGTFGPKCAQNCSMFCGSDCDPVDGSCKPCKAGWEGNKCTKPCKSGNFGRGCTNICSKNCEDVCSAEDGSCQNCKVGWIGTNCTQPCINGTFGLNCVQNCSKYCDSDCDPVDGYCQPCKAGWKGKTCIQPCESGSFGRGCINDCSKNCEDVCNAEDGSCQNCKAGWIGINCTQQCANGTFGIGCNNSCSINCENVCDATDGSCSPCKAGWKGKNCTQPCDSGKFGRGCINNCSKNCESGCDKVDGRCQQCKAGWKGNNCTQQCDNRTYGSKCIYMCGHCKDDSECNKANGTCLSGCASGFTGDTCLTENLADAASSQELITPVISTVVSLIVLSIFVVTVVVVLRRKRLLFSKDRQVKNGSPVKPDEGTSPEKAQAVPSDTDMSSSHAPRRKTNSDSATRKRDSLNVYYNAGTSARETSTHTVDIVDFRGYVEGLLVCKDFFTKEFKKLPSGLIHPTEDAKKPEHVGKNRYKDMVAYDHSRVILQTLPDKPDSDYINASFIQGYYGDNTYIAAQGPTEVNINDFWRMIWEQDVRTIVMLTNVVEETKKKCVQYWDNTGETLQLGSVLVHTVREHVFAEFTIRHFRVSHEDNPEVSRNVTHFHFTSWPDKDVPQSTSCLLHFWRKVRNHDENKKSIWLVHCSAGVGRTGTFIALDLLYEQGKDMGYLDVYHTVLDLRQQRVNMVQTKDQYVYIHKMLVEEFVLPSTPVKTESFHSFCAQMKETYGRTGKTKLLLEYQVLRDEPLDLQEENEEKMYSAAKLAENKDKNRYDNILAANEFRPLLFTDIAGRTNYINAVYIPSYCDSHCYILTQTPLPDTAIDFCRLLYEQEVKVIVIFDNNRKEQVGVCFPESGSLKVGPFTILHVEDKTEEVYKKSTLKLSIDKEERTIYRLAFNHWPTRAIVPSDVFKMNSFLLEVEQLKKQYENKPVIVQCLNGAERSGLLVTLLNILEYARFDGEVSIPQVIRQMRIRRQQIIPNFEQYKFCHEVFSCFAESNATYANL